LYGFYNKKVGNINSEINVVFNYHTNKVIENIYNLNNINISEIKKQDLDVVI